MDKLFLAEFIINALLVGLIWTIQVLVYPSFLEVDENHYESFHQHHTRAITPLVLPLMISELILAIIQKNFVSLLFLSIIWFTTFFISVPIHDQLVLKKDKSQIKRLVLTNWLRTISWTLKLLTLIIILVAKNS